jgi:hypothetical protein
MLRQNKKHYTSLVCSKSSADKLRTVGCCTSPPTLKLEKITERKKEKRNKKNQAQTLNLSHLTR